MKNDSERKLEHSEQESEILEEMLQLRQDANELMIDNQNNANKEKVLVTDFIEAERNKILEKYNITMFDWRSIYNKHEQLFEAVSKKTRMK